MRVPRAELRQLILEEMLTLYEQSRTPPPDLWLPPVEEEALPLVELGAQAAKNIEESIEKLKIFLKLLEIMINHPETAPAEGLAEEFMNNRADAARILQSLESLKMEMIDVD